MIIILPFTYLSLPTAARQTTLFDLVFVVHMGEPEMLPTVFYPKNNRHDFFKQVGLGPSKNLQYHPLLLYARN